MGLNQRLRTTNCALPMRQHGKAFRQSVGWQTVIFGNLIQMLEMIVGVGLNDLCRH